MTEKDIFNRLFETARGAGIQRGAVAAALVRNGEIIAECAATDVPNRHAEDLLLEKIANEGIEILPDDILYSTIEPCGKRTPGGGGEQFGDCATKIIASPLKHVVYAVPDPHYSGEVKARMDAAGISFDQVADSTIVEESRQMFNETMTDEEYAKKKGDHLLL